MIDKNEKINLEAATFRRLVDHLQKNTDLQNIDLMNLAGFCRNCLSKWMVEEAQKNNMTLDYEEVRNEMSMKMANMMAPTSSFTKRENYYKTLFLLMVNKTTRMTFMILKGIY